VRTDRRAEDVANVYRGALRSLDPALPAMDVRSLSDVIASSMRQRTLTAAILGTFAVSALLLAAIGLYGVVSYSVAQRTQEFGIRAAIGARGVNLMALVLWRSAAHVSTGIVIGVILSLAARRLVAAQLFGVASGDPWVLIVSASVLGFVGLAAAAVPTVRAVRVDPLEALRAQ
jgi:putative ABC transport system permease protein